MPAKVEIVVKKKGCMLCDLAEAMLEETAEELPPNALTWEVVEARSPAGAQRVEELATLCGQRPAMPSLFINQTYAFDHIPEMGTLTEALHQACKAPAILPAD